MRGALLWALLTLPTWAQGQGAAPAASRFELSPSKAEAAIGEPVELSGRAVFPSRYSFSGLAQGQSAEPFEILSVEAGQASSKDGVTTLPLRIRTAAFALGDETLPALSWTLKEQDGSVETLQSPPVRLRITGPQPSPEADIRDIAGPISPQIWPWLLLAAALAGLAAAGAVRAWRRRLLDGQEPQPPSDTRTPDEIALDELKALAGLELPVKEYYDRLSDILRAYLERRFDLPALRMTTSDLQRRMRLAELDSQARALTKTLLDRCDLAKFARYLPEKKEILEDCAAAQEIVRITRPPRIGTQAKQGQETTP